MSDPTNVGLLGHRWGVWLRDDSGTYEQWLDRVQNVEHTIEIPSTAFYELGNVDKVGQTQEPADFRWTIMENMHNCEMDAILAGKDPEGATIELTAGEIIDNTGACRACLVSRDVGGTDPVREIIYEGLAVTEIAYRFQVGGACEESVTMEGISGSAFSGSANCTHQTWGTFDTTAPGGVNGKDARIYFSGSAAGNRQYRLQSFNVRVAYPNQPVKELGRRAKVGSLADSPDVTIDFDLLKSDLQPDDILFTAYDYNDPALIATSYVHVFDPDGAEGATIIKAFKLENLRVTGGSPVRAQVRGLATNRYTMTVEKATTAGSAGLHIRNHSFAV
jgi:hypothetical protein